jgi:hypothetical protein
MDHPKRTIGADPWSWQTLATWFVPPVVIPGVLIIAFVAYLIFQALVA